MILSYRHRFVFIKGRKVAGTSIEAAMTPICGPDDIVTPITAIDEVERLKTSTGPRNYARDPNVERAHLAAVRGTDRADLAAVKIPRTPFRNHMPLTAVLALVPEAATMRVIVCERSPYAKIISMANMNVRFDAYRTGGAMHANLDDLRREAADLVESGGMRRVLNIDLYRDGQGALNVEALRYERLIEDLGRLARSLGVAPLALPHLKRGLMSNGLNPQDVFDRGQIDAINDAFADEFAAFGHDRI